MLRLYGVVARGLAPLAPLWLGRRVVRGKEDRARLAERYGVASMARPAGRVVWVHAASMGETMSALRLIEALAATVSVVLTTGTMTSAALAAARARAIHQFVPLDVPGFAARFLDHWRPDAAVFLESELWPNLLAALDVRGVPRFLFNARLSARSAARWQRLGKAGRGLLGGFRLIAAQSARDADLLRDLGLDRVVAWGNLKFAAPVLPDDAAARAGLGSACAGPWVLAASTHAGEDAAVIAAHRAMVRVAGGVVTVIVPRHPERADQVAKLAGALHVARRSRGEMPRPGGIYLADTLAELGVFYRLCRVGFIGGSLVAVGGHNMIEAAQLGCVCVVGPHTENHGEAMAMLRDAGALVEVADGAELGGVLARLILDDAALARMAAAGRAVCEGFADVPERLAACVIEAIGGG